MTNDKELEDKIKKFIKAIEITIFSDTQSANENMNLNKLSPLFLNTMAETENRNKSPHELAILFYHCYFSEGFMLTVNFDYEKNKLIFKMSSAFEFYHQQKLENFLFDQWEKIVDITQFGVEIQIITRLFFKGITQTRKHIICSECNEDYKNNELKNQDD